MRRKIWKIRDEEKTLAVKKLMPESLLNYRFRGTASSYEELLVALENIIMDKVTALSAKGGRKTDTSAPMEIGMAAGSSDKEALGSSCGSCSHKAQGGASKLAMQAKDRGKGVKGGWN